MENIGNVTTLTELYNQGDFTKILEYSNGRIFLKLRSMSRPNIMKKFAEKNGMPIMKQKEMFNHIFKQNINESSIDGFIRNESNMELQNRINDRNALYTELFKMDILDWGGLYQNGLEKTIVNNYVKKIKNYDELNKKINDELHESMAGYVRSSWYNNWSTILIESMFMEHSCILPAIGKVKNLDFFWNNIPLDLKVTYFPNEFLNDKRKEKGFGTELSCLKKFAKKNNIHYDKKGKDKSIFVEIYKKLSESHNMKEKIFLSDFKKIRMDIIQDAIKQPEYLARWLYEKQSERRFDRVYRFYLILVDTVNFEDSWKLKRSRDLVPDGIRHFLSKTPERIIKDISFKWKGDTYDTKCFVLFIVK